ncbi:tubulin alpha chain [Elysia marginata]|uniref:Tubulin alpha chain n=1 Tax=Elysia marginata TaxID=1093978 RepID=A0AAV4EXB9_9GAST|nr:tubulin alpha chain [Elysia marginata]
MGQTCWELYCLEHGILPDGTMNPDGHVGRHDNSFNTFFREKEDGKRIPRAVFSDLEPSAVEEVRKGPYGKLFHPEGLIARFNEAAGVYAKGHFTVGREALEYVTDYIRKLTEECSALQGFLIFRSYGGGTGSGFASIIMERLSQDYGRKTQLDFPIYAGPQLSTAATETYNSVLTAAASLHPVNCAFLLDNEAMYETCQNVLGVETPQYTHLNQLIGQVVSSITASLRSA